MRVLLDTDAFLILRHCGLLEHLAATASVQLLATEFVARHELNDVHAVVEALERRGTLTVSKIERGTPAYKRLRALVSAKVDKGEAEAITWAELLDDGDPPATFVSHDRGARRAASKAKLDVVDPLDLLVRLVALGHLEFETVRAHLAHWDDQPKGFGRPADFTTFEDTFARRKAALGR